MGAESFAAHGALDWAALAAERGAPGDRERALERVAQARAAGERLANPRVLRRAHAIEAELRGAIPLHGGRAGGARPRKPPGTPRDRA
jgi:hypothetical protein